MQIKFENVVDLKEYLFLGKAFLTVKSLKTNTHFTYRISIAPSNGTIHFVWVKSFENKFVYLGLVRNKTIFERSQGSLFTQESLPFIAFNYLFSIALRNTSFPTELEVYHTGQCGRCGRFITHPTSIKRGIGPECFKVLGLKGSDF